MQLTRTQIIFLGVVLVIILAVALIFTGILPGLRKTEKQNSLQGNLTVWGVEDTETIFNDSLFAEYQKANPGVQLTYRQMSPATYEEDLINDLAAGTGPDIFMFKNTWLPKHANKISPLTPEQFPLEKFKQYFPTAVEQDFTIKGTVYALPLHLDTLVLVSNRTLLDNAGLANPPQTWEQLLAMIPRLRKTDATGRLVQAAIALGGSNKSLNHASDILSSLFLQDGVEMTNEEFTRATFAREGEKALKFYISFANSASQAYTWNDGLPEAFDAFSQEKVAMVLAYGNEIATLQKKNPFLPINLTQFLQPNNARLSVNYPSYWGLAVSNKSRQATLAWNFIFAATTNSAINQKYLEKSGRSPALRALIDFYANDSERSVFSRQALTAKSWRQIDSSFISETLSKMLQSILEGERSPEAGLEVAEEKITELMQRKNTP